MCSMLDISIMEHTQRPKSRKLLYLSNIALDPRSQLTY